MRGLYPRRQTPHPSAMLRHSRCKASAFLETAAVGRLCTLSHRGRGRREVGALMKFFSFWRSLASFRVRIALNLKNLPAEVVFVDLDADAHRTDEYRSINPQMA